MRSFDYISEKAPAKINLSLRVLGKTSNNYHLLESIITFLPDIYDKVFIKKSKNLNINITGRFAKSLKNNGGDTLVKKMIFMFRKKYNISNNFEVIIKKNIPIGAGLGGGSADAAAVARLMINMYNLKIKKKNLVDQLSLLGSDIPACFFSYNQKIGGFGEKLYKLENLNKRIWSVLIKPKVNFNTSDIFQKFSKPFSKKSYYNYSYKNLILDINTKDNDLQEVAEEHSTIFKNFLKKLPCSKGISKPRMTGSGSTIFILFDSKRNAENYLHSLEKINKSVWKKISQVLL